MSEQFPGELDSVKRALKQAELSPIKPNSDPDTNSPISPRLAAHSSSDESSPILRPTRHGDAVGQVEKHQLSSLSKSQTDKSQNADKSQKADKQTETEKNESIALSLVSRSKHQQHQQQQSSVDPLVLLNGLSEKMAKTRAAIQTEFRSNGLLIKFLKIHEESNQLKQRLNMNELKRKQCRDHVITFLNKIECRNIPLSKFLDHDDLKVLGYPENIRLTSRARTTRSSKLISEKLSENETVDAIIDGLVQSCGITTDQGKALYEQWMNVALVAKIARRTVGNQLANEIDSKKEKAKTSIHYLSVTGKKQSGKKRKHPVNNIISSDDESTRNSPKDPDLEAVQLQLQSLKTAASLSSSPSSPSSSIDSSSEKVDDAENNEKIGGGGGGGGGGGTTKDNDRRRKSIRDSIRQGIGAYDNNRPFKKARRTEDARDDATRETRETTDKKHETRRGTRETKGWCLVSRTTSR